MHIYFVAFSGSFLSDGEPVDDHFVLILRPTNTSTSAESKDPLGFNISPYVAADDAYSSPYSYSARDFTRLIPEEGRNFGWMLMMSGRVRPALTVHCRQVNTDKIQQVRKRMCNISKSPHTEYTTVRDQDSIDITRERTINTRSPTCIHRDL